jgi:hypothetical protein
VATRSDPVRTIDVSAHTSGPIDSDHAELGTDPGLDTFVTTGSPIKWQVVAYDGDDLPMANTGITIDACLFTLGRDADGNLLVSRSQSSAESNGNTETPLSLALIDDDIVASERVSFGVLACTNPGPAASTLKIFVLEGVVR